MTPGSSDLRGPQPMDQREHQMAQRSHNLRSGPWTQSGTIVSEGNITDVVRSVFNAPMLSDEGQEAWRIGLRRSQRGNQVYHLLARFASRANGDSSRPCSDVLNHWPTIQRGMHIGADTDTARVDTPTMKITSRALHEGDTRISTRGRHIRRQRHLMVCDGKNGCATQSINALHKIVLGMKSVSGEDASRDRHTGQEGLRDWDGIRLLGNDNVEQCFLAVMRTKGEHVSSRVRVCSGSAHGCYWVLWCRHQHVAYPVSQSPCDGLGIQAGKQCAVQGIGRAQETTWSAQPFEQRVAIPTPLGKGQRRARMAEQTCDQAGEQGRQFRAQSMGGTQVWQCGKDLGEAQQWGG